MPKKKQKIQNIDDPIAATPDPETRAPRPVLPWVDIWLTRIIPLFENNDLASFRLAHPYFNAISEPERLNRLAKKIMLLIEEPAIFNPMKALRLIENNPRILLRQIRYILNTDPGHKHFFISPFQLMYLTFNFDLVKKAFGYVYRYLEDEQDEKTFFVKNATIQHAEILSLLEVCIQPFKSFLAAFDDHATQQNEANSTKKLRNEQFFKYSEKVIPEFNLPTGIFLILYTNFGVKFKYSFFSNKKILFDLYSNESRELLRRACQLLREKARHNVGYSEFSFIRYTSNLRLRISRGKSVLSGHDGFYSVRESSTEISIESIKLFYNSLVSAFRDIYPIELITEALPIQCHH